LSPKDQEQCLSKVDQGAKCHLLRVFMLSWALCLILANEERHPWGSCKQCPWSCSSLLLWRWFTNTALLDIM
jgi:hypothetical protein